jgi:hypothetical protein
VSELLVSPRTEVKPPTLIEIIKDQLVSPDNAEWRAVMRRAYKPTCGCTPEMVKVRIVVRERERRADGCCRHQTCAHFHKGEREIRELPFLQALPILATQVENLIQKHLRRVDLRLVERPAATIVRELQFVGGGDPISSDGFDYALFYAALHPPSGHFIITLVAKFIEGILSAERSADQARAD